MPTVSVVCPSCGAKLSLPETSSAKFRCPTCAKVLSVYLPTLPPAPVPPPSTEQMLSDRCSVEACDEGVHVRSRSERHDLSLTVRDGRLRVCTDHLDVREVDPSPTADHRPEPESSCGGDEATAPELPLRCSGRVGSTAQLQWLAMIESTELEPEVGTAEPRTRREANYFARHRIHRTRMAQPQRITTPTRQFCAGSDRGRDRWTTSVR